MLRLDLTLALPLAGTPRARLLALVLLALLLVPIVAGGLLPLLRWAQSGEDSDARRLAQLQQIAARAPEQEAQWTALSAQQGDRGDYLAGASSAIAAADLQSRIAVLLREAGSDATSSESLPPVQDQGFTRLAVREHFIANHVMLRSILYQIEAGRPRLSVDSLSIHRIANRSDLDVTADIVGFWAEATP